MRPWPGRASSWLRGVSRFKSKPTLATQACLPLRLPNPPPSPRSGCRITPYRSAVNATRSFPFSFGRCSLSLRRALTLASIAAISSRTQAAVRSVCLAFCSTIAGIAERSFVKIVRARHAPFPSLHPRPSPFPFPFPFHPTITTLPRRHRRRPPRLPHVIPLLPFAEGMDLTSRCGCATNALSR